MIQLKNEPMRTYAKGSEEWNKLQAAIKEMHSQVPYDVPCIVNGQEVYPIHITSLVSGRQWRVSICAVES